MMMNQLENKVALITGGASRPGLGSAIADKFAAEGAFVFLTDIDESGCNASLDVIKNNGGQGAALKHNVTDEKDWDNVFAAIKEQKANSIFWLIMPASHNLARLIQRLQKNICVSWTPICTAYSTAPKELSR